MENGSINSNKFAPVLIGANVICEDFIISSGSSVTDGTTLSRCFIGQSCPVGLGVSCSADRNIKCKINKEGIWIEKLDDNPSSLIPQELRQAGEGDAVKIDLNQPMKDVLKELTKYPVATRLSLTGTIIVGRDIAHATPQAPTLLSM